MKFQFRVSIEDCLKQPPEYLKEVCRGIVPPSLSPQITTPDSFITALPSVMTDESSVPMDFNTETEEGDVEKTLSADPSNAIVHGDNVGALTIMGVMAGYIFHIYFC